jgi:ABC-type polysaccharide/polyol phosphate transport system ATPase subunit
VNTVIEVEHVSKRFPARRGARDLRGRGGVRDWLMGRRQELFTALHDISFTVGPGESLGIIGRNGSGKSTLLSLLAGVTLPSEGRVAVNGRVASLLELGAGFHPVLTGRENVYLNAGLLGMRHAQTDAVFDDIVRFSGIGAFIDQPVETYSSGMYVRIGFSVAVHSNPDIFLVDEVLSVGDEEFQRRCRAKIGELREQGKTIVFVSHDLSVVNTLCERVILLSDGRMVQRETPQKTISFYLRQVGAEKGLHVFSRGEEEAIQCDGRVSLYHKGNETTSSGGITMDLGSLGQYHNASMADWTVTDKRASGCTACGRMTRLPVSLIWDMDFDERGRVVWEAALECERDVQVQGISANVHLPVAYDRWLYGDFGGAFPDILPSDMRPSLVAAPEMRSCEAAALPQEGVPLSPLVFHLQPQNPNFSLNWYNTEYLRYSRLLLCVAVFPEHACTFGPGRHPLLRLEIDPNVERGSVEAQLRSGQTVESGALVARFEHGCLRLFHEGVELTHHMNVYSSMLIEHLWNDSHSLQWGGVQEIEGGIAFNGESRRFPFRQRWEITSVPDGIALCIWVENHEPLVVHEYHTAVVLRADYAGWNTDQERGAFPPFDPAATHWKHCNRSFAAGKSATAWSAALPSVTIDASPEAPTVRMTAINTTYQENARVLLALRPSEDGRIRFEPGRHLYFSGVISTGPAGETS